MMPRPTCPTSVPRWGAHNLLKTKALPHLEVQVGQGGAQSQSAPEESTVSDLTEMKPFWMVYGLGQRGPTFQHETEASALREAERLAEVSPGTTFVVLEATEAVRVRRFDRFDLRTAPCPPGTRLSRAEVGDDIPF